MGCGCARRGRREERRIPGGYASDEQRCPAGCRRGPRPTELRRRATRQEGGHLDELWATIERLREDMEARTDPVLEDILQALELIAEQIEHLARRR